MKVVLLQHIRGIGQMGDIKDVNDGYARNFLFPKHAARPATEGTVKDVTAGKAKKLQAVELAQQQARELAASLTGTRIELSGKANTKGTLFAAITQITIGGRTFSLPEPIKTTGEHPVVIELADGVTASLIVVVTAA